MSVTIHQASLLSHPTSLKPSPLPTPILSFIFSLVLHIPPAPLSIMRGDNESRLMNLGMYLREFAVQISISTVAQHAAARCGDGSVTGQRDFALGGVF